jgi:cupin fold WbuC family metalloprotein
MHKFIKFNHAITLQKFLKKKLKKSQKVFRYIFHKDEKDKDQLMMIWQKKNYYFPPKKFLDTQKIYFLNKGKLNIYIFDASGRLLQIHKLSKNNPICKIKKNVFHADVAKSSYAIHCEVTAHSFKSRKIVFMNLKNESKIKQILIS